MKKKEHPSAHLTSIASNKRTTENDRTYIHLIKISLQYDKLIINDKKEIKTKDTFTYAVNADLLSLCPESGKSEKEFKLINSYHKVRP